MKLFLTNRTNYRVSRILFVRILKRAHSIFNFEIDELSLAIIDQEEIHCLNRIYRRKDEPTDVLSFDYGEILLCPEYIKEKYHLTKNAVHFKMIELFVHGLVHIAGFDHNSIKEQKEMKSREEEIFA